MDAMSFTVHTFDGWTRLVPCPTAAVPHELSLQSYSTSRQTALHSNSGGGISFPGLAEVFGSAQ